MKLTFLGGTETVTGSKYLLESDGNRYLIDCGLFQGLKELRLRNWDQFPVDPRTIKAVIMTHAHLDHCGYLPLLVKQGFHGSIYSSFPTRDLCRIILLDSGRLQEEDARRANKYNYSKHKPALALYTEKDAEQCLKLFHPVEFEKVFPLKEGISFILERSGHILGSSFVTIKVSGVEVVFSGDLGRPNDPIMRHAVQIKNADYLIMESTYGNRLHPKIDASIQLASVINSVVSKNGTLVIPAFAIGRAQTILYYIYKLKEEKLIPDNIPVYIDSPMALEATELWRKFTEEYSITPEECKKVCDSAIYIRSQEESKRINASKGSSIIISASGMAEGGRVLHHISFYGPKPENTILFAGYQAEGTRGDRLLKGEKLIKIYGQMIPIQAQIASLENLSSHADYAEIIEWLRGLDSPPKEIFLTHGETNASEFLRDKIIEAFG